MPVISNEKATKIITNLVLLIVIIIITAKIISLFYHKDSIKHIHFETKTIQISNADTQYSFQVETADTQEKLEYGLKNRTNMDINRGMLFIFGEEKEVNMWMQDTYIPLDMLFIKNKIITKIAADTTPLSLKTISSGSKVTAVLELNAGTCKNLNIKIGDKIDF